MAVPFEIDGESDSAQFTLKLRRGEGMVLLTMNWRNGKPPEDFVGFAIEFRPPDADRFFALTNRLAFPAADGSIDSETKSTKLSPLQKFRWVHFPRDAEVEGEFVYRVSPAFMDDDDELSFGEPQSAAIELGGETYPDKLNVCFTRGFVYSQAFVDHYEPAGPISTLLPAKAKEGLTFEPTHPEASKAYEWMGFEARRAVLAVLDEAIADDEAVVKAIAYDLNEPEVVSRLERLGDRLQVIIDNSKDHKESGSAENQAEERLIESAGEDNVKRQHMADLQHNKTIVVDGPAVKAVVCGSTNLSWRGFYVQANNAVILRGDSPVEIFGAAFDGYWRHDDVDGFGATPSAELVDLGLEDIDARIAFSPHLADNALLHEIADDIDAADSSILYSLAFIYQTKGAIRDAIKRVTEDDAIFVYGISDKTVDGIDVQGPSGNVAPVSFAALTEDVPPPFNVEPTPGMGTQMHHKFVVIDFDKPSARVYLGSYNFSPPADVENGENLLIVRDRRIVVAYAVEALRIFDHYQFRVAAKEAKDKGQPLMLSKPPREPGEKPWWDKYYSDPQRVRDRVVFA